MTTGKDMLAQIAELDEGDVLIQRLNGIRKVSPGTKRSPKPYADIRLPLTKELADSLIGWACGAGSEWAPVLVWVRKSKLDAKGKTSNAE